MQQAIQYFQYTSEASAHTKEQKKQFSYEVQDENGVEESIKKWKFSSRSFILFHVKKYACTRAYVTICY